MRSRLDIIASASVLLSTVLAMVWIGAIDHDALWPVVVQFLALVLWAYAGDRART